MFFFTLSQIHHLHVIHDIRNLVVIPPGKFYWKEIFLWNWITHTWMKLFLLHEGFVPIWVVTKLNGTFSVLINRDVKFLINWFWTNILDLQNLVPQILISRNFLVVFKFLKSVVSEFLTNFLYFVFFQVKHFFFFNFSYHFLPSFLPNTEP